MIRPRAGFTPVSNQGAEAATVPPASPEAPLENIAIFDGGCGFCAWSLAHFRRCFEPRGMVCVPYQWVPAASFARFGTDAARCARALHVWNVGEQRLYRGADAINRLAADTRLARRAIKIIIAFRPLLRAERCAYAFVARHRSLISRLLGTRRYAVIRETEVTVAGEEP